MFRSGSRRWRFKALPARSRPAAAPLQGHRRQRLPSGYWWRRACNPPLAVWLHDGVFRIAAERTRRTILLRLCRHGRSLWLNWKLPRLQAGVGMLRGAPDPVRPPYSRLPDPYLTPTRPLPDPYPTPTRPLPLPYHSFQANPPFVPSLVLTMASHVRGLLDAAEMGDRELLFVVIVGSSSAMRKSDAWGALQELAHGRFGRSQWIVPLHHHGYTAGHAHIEKEGEQRRMSSCESAVFVFASSAANQRWPSTPEKESLFRAAMRLALPQKMKRLRKADQKVSRQRKMSKKRRRVGQP